MKKKLINCTCHNYHKSIQYITELQPPKGQTLFIHVPTYITCLYFVKYLGTQKYLNTHGKISR